MPKNLLWQQKARCNKCISFNKLIISFLLNIGLLAVAVRALRTAFSRIRPRTAVRLQVILYLFFNVIWVKGSVPDSMILCARGCVLSPDKHTCIVTLYENQLRLRTPCAEGLWLKMTEMRTNGLFFCNGDVYLDNWMHARKNCATAAVTFSSLALIALRERPESMTHQTLEYW